MVYTAFPIISHGVLDKDVPRAVARAVPALYRDGLEHAYLSVLSFWGWMLEGVVHAVLVTFLPIYAFGHFTFLPEGKNSGIWDLGTIVFLAVMTVASLRIAQEVVDWQWIVTTLLLASLAVWWLSWVALNWWLALAPSAFGSFIEMTASSRFWLTYLLATIACFALSFALEVRAFSCVGGGYVRAGLGGKCVASSNNPNLITRALYEPPILTHPTCSPSGCSSGRGAARSCGSSWPRAEGHSRARRRSPTLRRWCPSRSRTRRPARRGICAEPSND